jgi:23S rRNA pseudouridine1911/1915/1917 synthase
VNAVAPFFAGCGIGSCILYEDQRFLVIDKPANLLVHPTGPGRPDTLWDELKRLLAFELVNGATISFINRLDRETSGLILVAKSGATARQLGLMIAQHRIRKTYTAIVFGSPLEESFVVEQPLLRQGMVRPSRIYLKQTVDPNGSPAFTSFRILKRFTVAAWPLP